MSTRWILARRCIQSTPEALDKGPGGPLHLSVFPILTVSAVPVANTLAPTTYSSRKP